MYTKRQHMVDTLWFWLTIIVLNGNAKKSQFSVLFSFLENIVVPYDH